MDQATETATVTKVQPVKCEILWSEGRQDRAGKVIASQGVGFWGCARAALIRIAYEEEKPDAIGYLKVGFRVTFADGHTYEGRCDLKHPSKPDNDCDVSAHIVSFVTFYTGERRPAHMTEAQYALVMKQTPAEQRQGYIDFRARYALTDAEVTG